MYLLLGFFFQQNGITYILNVSTTSPRPSFIQDGHFLRVPVNDSYCDKLLPFFQEAFQFLGIYWLLFRYICLSFKQLIPLLVNVKLLISQALPGIQQCKPDFHLLVSYLWQIGSTLDFTRRIIAKQGWSIKTKPKAVGRPTTEDLVNYINGRILLPIGPSTVCDRVLIWSR